jgi:Na+/phosphate symporter
MTQTTIVSGDSSLGAFSLVERATQTTARRSPSNSLTTKIERETHMATEPNRIEQKIEDYLESIIDQDLDKEAIDRVEARISTIRKLNS